MQHGFVKTQVTPEVELHYVSAGPLAGPVVLFLHGFPEFWYAWKDYLDPLAAAGFHAVALDLRGYNESSHPKGVEQYHLDLLVSDVRAVIQHFGGTVHLVGHDWGGIIAWEVAARYPEMLLDLVIMNAPHRGAWKENFSLKQMLKSWYAGFFQLPALPELFLKAGDFRVLEKMFTPSYTKGEIEEYKKALGKEGVLRAAVDYYRANMKSFGKVSEQIIHTRVLLIWGERDQALEKDLNDGLEKYVHGELTKKFYPDATHWVHREKTKEVLKDLMMLFLP